MILQHTLENSLNTCYTRCWFIQGVGLDFHKSIAGLCGNTFIEELGLNNIDCWVTILKMTRCQSTLVKYQISLSIYSPLSTQHFIKIGWWAGIEMESKRSESQGVLTQKYHGQPALLGGRAVLSLSTARCLESFNSRLKKGELHKELM